jgi:hypothetical protein
MKVVLWAETMAVMKAVMSDWMWVDLKDDP